MNTLHRTAWLAATLLAVTATAPAHAQSAGNADAEIAALKRQPGLVDANQIVMALDDQPVPRSIYL